MLLYLFSFLAGGVTILSPCILPVLPALFAVGAQKGRLRPLGVALGFALSFTIATLFLHVIISYLGIPANLLRYFAVLVLAGFGLVMIIPSWTAWFEKATEKLADAGSEIQSLKVGTGFWSGLLLGAAMGLVWTPCAGPILASVIALAVTNQVTAHVAGITLAYSIGAALPMLMIAYGLKWIIGKQKNLENIRKFFGYIMIVTAAAIYLDLPIFIQQWSSKFIPPIEIENRPNVIKQLRDMRNFAERGSEAPNFDDIAGWINSEPLSIYQLRGRPVLIDFWTYSCINCIRTFPHLKKWYEQYKDKGLVIVGVHTPEFQFEKDKGNVKKAAERFGIAYPIALDNDYSTWNAYKNLYWPALYLIDQNGKIVYSHFGEGASVETENEIRKLLNLPALSEKEEPKFSGLLTPEIYLGWTRAESYAHPLKLDEAYNYEFPAKIGKNSVALKGLWKAGLEKMTSESDTSEISLRFIGSSVYLVMSGSSELPVRVEIDGRPQAKEEMTTDTAPAGEFKVHEPRKFDIVHLNNSSEYHTLTLFVPKGISLYAFTFGNE